MIDHLFLPYRLELDRPLLTAAGAVHERSGVVIGLEFEGVLGWGDLCPRPERDPEELKRLEAQVRAWVRSSRARTPDDALWSVERDATLDPASSAAIELALIDLLARREGVPVSRWLGGARAVDQPEVNTLASTAAEAVAAAERGFGTVKLKVGVADPMVEAETVLDLRDRVGPTMAIRLDANQAWTVEQATAFVQAVAAADIEYLEEPLADPTPLADWSRTSPVPIGADESLVEPELVARLLDTTRLVTVVKPVELGGWRRLHRLAIEYPGRVVVSSSIESSIGRTGAAHLAAAAGTSAPAAGLDTGRLLASDVAPAPSVRSGRFELPRGAGLAIEPDRA